MNYISWEEKNRLKAIAETLPIDGFTYVSHTDCTSSDKLWVKNTPSKYIYFCNKCGAKGASSKGIQHVSKLKHKDHNELIVEDVVLPEDVDYDISNWPRDAKLWLYKSDIRNFQIEKYGICYSKSLHRVIIPVYNESRELITWQGRGLREDQTKYLNLKSKKKNDTFFKSWVSKEKIHNYTTNRIIVVEDALSVITVGRYCPTVAALGTSLSTAQAIFLGNFDEVVFWMDDDRGGLEGSVKGMRKVALLTNVKRIRTREDPKKLSCDEIKRILNDN